VERQLAEWIVREVMQRGVILGQAADGKGSRVQVMRGLGKGHLIRVTEVAEDEKRRGGRSV
jgi:hypothetical protein